MLKSFLATTTSVCLISSCDYSIDLASQHLHSLGYKGRGLRASRSRSRTLCCRQHTLPVHVDTL